MTGDGRASSGGQSNGAAVATTTLPVYETSMKHIECVVSGGGPIIAIPSELAQHWRGTLPPLGVAVPPGWTWGQGGIICDYDRACDDLHDAIEIGDSSAWTVPVADGRALVLDGEASTAAVLWDDGVVLARVPPFESDEEALEALANVTPQIWRASPHSLRLREGRLFVFDSAWEGASTSSAIGAEGGVLDITLRAGRYCVAYAAQPYPTDRGTYPLIRLSPAES